MFMRIFKLHKETPYERKKWFVFVISLYNFIILGICILVAIVDPYFHFHAPIDGFSYELDDAEYRNDGIAKHFSYNAIITGTSMTRIFKTAEATTLFQKDFIRITYLGEGFKRINDNLKKAISSNPNLDFVIRGVDPIWFISDESWIGGGEFPDYLYDNQLWNDVNYIYNKEILLRDVVPELIATIKKEPPETFDDYVTNHTGNNGIENVLDNYIRPEKEDRYIVPLETKEFFDLLEKNLEANVISTISENPDITFYIFFPPYSICWWDSLNQNDTDTLKRRIDMEQYVIEKLLQYENVHFFSFFNNFDLVCDLDNYIDDVHYTPKINSQILTWMKEGTYQLTMDNYLDYINEITKFYTSYNYDRLFE